MVQAQLNGFLPPDFSGTMPTLDVRNPPNAPRWQAPPVDIRDGRALQIGGKTEAELLDEHGFVLLQHQTAVRDWDQDVGAIYLPETEAIIRERLFPGRRVEVQQGAASLLRRGRGTSTPAYANGIHSDGPLTVEHYAENVRAFASDQAEAWWRGNYEREDVAGFVSLDFWRVTNMKAPLEHMPLAVCEPASLDAADIVELPMIGIAPEGRTTNHLILRHNPEQRWYYFPKMTADEVLVFKLNEYWKDDPHAHPQNCFHTAFADPAARADAEERQSCEHRVGVLFLRD